jgi:hypothetical protein
LIVADSRFTARSPEGTGIALHMVRVVPLRARASDPSWGAVPRANPPRVSFVGNVSIRKGAHLLIDAWRRLGEHWPIDAGDVEALGERLKQCVGRTCGLEAMRGSAQHSAARRPWSVYRSEMTRHCGARSRCSRARRDARVPRWLVCSDPQARSWRIPA